MLFQSGDLSCLLATCETPVYIIYAEHESWHTAVKSIMLPETTVNWTVAYALLPYHCV